MNHLETCRAHDEHSGLPCPSCGYLRVPLPGWIIPRWNEATGWYHPLFTVGNAPAIWLVESHGFGNKLSRKPPKGFDTHMHREDHVTASSDGPHGRVLLEFSAEDLKDAKPF
jgi:hypothetical protein